MQTLRYLIGIVLKAWRLAVDAASEATAELWAEAFKLGRGAKLAGSHAAVGAGAALAGPATVLDALGGLLGRILPQRGVTAAQVADAAVAEDEAVYAVAPEPEPLTLPELVKLHAGHLSRGADDVDLPVLPHAVSVWVEEMGPQNRAFVARMPAASIERHMEASDPRHLMVGIRPIPTEADMRQRERDVAEALTAMEADGRLDAMRAEMLRDMRFDADDRVGSAPAFA